MKNSEYWEKRIADNTWDTYNDLEQRNRALLEMYQDAALDIEDELYRVSTKMKTATPMLSDMHKYNRLSGLKEKIDERTKELAKQVQEFGTKNMYEGFKKVYSNVTLEVTGTEFDEVPDDVMKEMFDRPWVGSNFSKRLWKDTKVLANNLNELLVIGLTQGKTITEIAIQLDNRMHAGFNNAHRLVRTETMHYLNESAFKAYVDSGCNEVQIWAAVDERTCPKCGSMHGKIFTIDKRPVLPFHGHCRCTYLPVIDETEAEKDYEEAQKQFNSESERRNDPEEIIKDKMIKNRTADNEQYKKYKNILKTEAPKSFEKFQKLKYNDVNKWNELKSDYKYQNMLNKRTKIKLGENNRSLPNEGDADSICDLINEDGSVKQRRIYGKDRRAVKDIDTTNHNKPKYHPMGAHKHEYNYSDKKPHGKAECFTDSELRQNKDIIKKGENYNDDR